MSGRLNGLRSLVLAALLLPLLVSAQYLDITGTTTSNISSDSTQLTYSKRWRSDTEDGVYTAYSNLSDAYATFSFVGVAAQYIAVRKADRGLCQITVDEQTSYTIDLYDGSGYTQGHQIIWSSPTLVFGAHNVTLSQLGPDARLGFYPYLVTESWIEYVPINISTYVATQSIPEPISTGSPSSNNSSSSNLAPIIGGVVGGVVALALLTFLIFLWRRDKAARARGEGAPVQKVKRAEGKMAIDDAPSGGWDGNGYSGYGYGAAAGAGAGAGGQHYQGSWADRQNSGHSGDGSWNSHHGLLPSGAAYGAAGPPTSPSSPSSASHRGPHSRFYDPVPYRGVTPDSYPYVVQGAESEKRVYAVPELG